MALTWSLFLAKLLHSVKMAHSRKVAVDKEKAEAKKKAEEAAAEEQAAKKRKEEQEAEQRTWDEKKRRLEDNIREIQEEIIYENESLMAGCCEQRFKAEGACSGAGCPEDCRGLPKLLMGGSSSY